MRSQKIFFFKKYISVMSQEICWYHSAELPPSPSPSRLPTAILKRIKYWSTFQKEKKKERKEKKIPLKADCNEKLWNLFQAGAGLCWKDRQQGENQTHNNPQQQELVRFPRELKMGKVAVPTPPAPEHPPAQGGHTAPPAAIQDPLNSWKQLQSRPPQAHSSRSG